MVSGVVEEQAEKGKKKKKAEERRQEVKKVRINQSKHVLRRLNAFLNKKQNK